MTKFMYTYKVTKKFLLSSLCVLSALLLSAHPPSPVDGEGSGLVTNDKIVKQGALAPLDYGDLHSEDLIHSGKDSVTQEVFKEHAAKVMTWHRAASPNTSVWGGSGGTLTMGSAYRASDSHFNGPFDDSNFNNKPFEGCSLELLIYNRIFTSRERRRVESYLAMKYGITLNDSYIDRDGNLVWDRDEAGGFLQPVSATSYEEAPAYTSVPGNDCYHNSNFYGLHSEAHLLVMGREYGNPMPDKFSLFWGDEFEKKRYVLQT